MAVSRLKDPRLSAEVRWFLRSRGIPFPKCQPLVLTPEPFDYPGALFDADKVDLVLSVFGRLRHTQGEWAGRPLRPDPWQIAYILAPAFGWVAPDPDGRLVRVIRHLYVEVPRKNGKTTTAGGLAAYLTTADGEPGAQVFAVATGKLQAKLCFDPVRAIAQKSPDLSPFIRTTNDKLVHVPSSSYFAAVSSVADLLHGTNVHGAVIDELHLHKDGKLVEAIETGMGARRQPLVLTITTADDSRQATVYSQTRERIEQLARGAFRDPSTFGVIWAAEAGDDPFVEATWKKANPGYGISPSARFMRDQAAKAQQSPADLSSFLRLHLNLRTKQEVRYLDLAAWDRCRVPLEEAELEGQVCHGGLDLASTSDLAAFALTFPTRQADGKVTYRTIWRHWAPEDALASLNKRTAGEAEVWVRNGWLLLTPGNVADYDFILEQIKLDRSRFAVQSIAYDPWNSSQLVNDLVADGAPMVQMSQGFAAISAPTKELQRLALQGHFGHDGSALIRWQVDNFAVDMDANGNVKPSKLRAGDKIDGIVAAIMAVDQAMRHKPAQELTYLGSA